jgi:hypothetical protein
MVVIARKSTGSKKKDTTKSIKVQKKTCCSCPSDRAEQSVNNFYKSYSKMHTDGHIPMCKTCIFEKCFNENINDIDVEMLKNILRQIDRPFIESVFQSSINQYNDLYEGKNVNPKNRTKIIGYYFKNIQTLRQYCTLDWNGGIEWNNRIISKNKDSTVEEKYTTKNSKDEEIYVLDDAADFVVTKDIIQLFGEGYKKFEYKAMWEKYDFLKKSCPVITNLHVEALVTYVRFKVKEEMATAQGNAIDAEKWNTAATKAADKAKINPSQLSQSDLQGGLNSFSEIFKAVEQAVDFIPILPRFRFRPNDALDFNIWCYINYIRDLEGKPLCEYEDVYGFYDKRKQEYLEQYGDPYDIFKDDPTVDNREKINKFISLPRDYEDGEELDGQT